MSSNARLDARTGLGGHDMEDRDGSRPDRNVTDDEESDVEHTAEDDRQSSAFPTKTMPVSRRKNIRLISNERQRMVTFAKRKGALIKKAAELSILCDVEVAVLIAPKHQKMTVFSSKPMEEIMKRYRNSHDWRALTIPDIYPDIDQHGNASVCDSDAYSAATRAAHFGGRVVVASSGQQTPACSNYLPSATGTAPMAYMMAPIMATVPTNMLPAFAMGQLGSPPPTTMHLPPEAHPACVTTGHPASLHSTSAAVLHHPALQTTSPLAAQCAGPVVLQGTTHPTAVQTSAPMQYPSSCSAAANQMIHATALPAFTIPPTSSPAAGPINAGVFFPRCLAQADAQRKPSAHSQGVVAQ